MSAATDKTLPIVERLRRQAEQSSNIARQMAEAKSLRQGGNTEQRTDLYMWPTPEQTVEGEAAALIETQTALLEECEGVLGALVEAAMDDEPWEAFPIAKHAGLATLAKLKERRDG